VKTDERVKDEQALTEGFDGVDEADAVLLQVEAYGDGGDDVDVELREADAGGATDPLETAADDVQGVFGSEEEDGPPLSATGKWRRQGAPEATATARSRARKDLQHLGSPPTMPTAWGGPQVADEPALLLGDCLEVSRAAGGKR
jgi:hypothetical protein